MCCSVLYVYFYTFTVTAFSMPCWEQLYHMPCRTKPHQPEKECGEKTCTTDVGNIVRSNWIDFRILPTLTYKAWCGRWGFVSGHCFCGKYQVLPELAWVAMDMKLYMWCRILQFNVECLFTPGRLRILESFLL